MKTVIVTRFGGPEVLEVREVSVPEPGPGEVRIRVKAAGLNYADIMQREGLYPGGPKAPFGAGFEVAGLVDAVGEGVDGRTISPLGASRNRWRVQGVVGHSINEVSPSRESPSIAWARGMSTSASLGG